jgi:hypothetical protein
MDAYPVKFDFGREVLSWLEGLGLGQAMYVLMRIAKIFKFAEENVDFFQGCGLYAAGSSLKGGTFNDIDLVLTGLDFRAVVSYDKVFLMDPETLIEKKIVVEPELFVIIDKDEEGRPKILKPIMDVECDDLLILSQQWSHMGLTHNGKRYDYDFREHAWLSLDLFGYCSGHGRASSFIKEIYQLLNPGDEFSRNLCHPFERYGSDAGPFLVYRISTKDLEEDLPVAKGSVIEEMKPIDLSIHAENLRREDWKNHQSRLKLPYLTLKEWSETSRVRRVITELDYPDFIDPNGIERAKWHPMTMHTYYPDEIPEAIEI